MQFINERKIKLEKPLSDLDKLVIRFTNLIKEHTDYVIISGYVAILLGRSRGTEDVDLFIKPIPKPLFLTLYHHLKTSGFWCLNAESDDEVYSYLEEGLALRFALQGETIPNFELKIAKKRIDQEVFEDFIEVETKEGILNISSLERQIAFKRYYLKSEKDLEDARHIEESFKDHIITEKIKKYKRLLELTHGKT